MQAIVNTKIGRNDPCPCGSGLKYKNCYLKENHCIISKKEKHDEKEKHVVAFLKDTTNEISYCIRYDDKGNPLIPNRAQLILLFVLADILSQYWDIYNGNSNKQSVYFTQWFKIFCTTDKNEKYSESEHLKKFSGQDFYECRNSLLHFYGIPRQSQGIQYIIAPDDQIIKKTRSKDKPQDLMKQIVDALDKDRSDYRIIQVEQIRHLIWRGGTLMIQKMKENLAKSPNFHIEGIDRIYKEVKDRGPMSIEMNQN